VVNLFQRELFPKLHAQAESDATFAQQIDPALHDGLVDLEKRHAVDQQTARDQFRVQDADRIAFARPVLRRRPGHPGLSRGWRLCGRWEAAVGGIRCSVDDAYSTRNCSRERIETGSDTESKRQAPSQR
jgi:hypothetical protein